MNERNVNPIAIPCVDCEQEIPTLWVSDVIAAADFYTKKLGFKLAFTWANPPEMAGVKVGEVSIHLAQGPPAPHPDGPSVYFVIGDADELCLFHQANGVEVVRPLGDRPYGLRDYTIRDPH